MTRSKTLRLVIALTSLCCLAHAGDGDWPMWRFDAGRTAASPHELPHKLHLQWVRHFGPRVMVWPDRLNQDRMPYDQVFEPVVLGKTLFLGFNDTDKLLALDTDTGEEKWAFYVDGPVRLPPVAADDKVLFTSDDGYLYCLDAATGALRWRFRGGPSDRKVLGNSRLISTWPARGGPVLEDGRVYFAASIWPFMGTFIYALDAETGQVVWRNDSTSAQWVNQPHRNPAFAGIAPQGAFVVAGDSLLVPGGRSVPACFDLATGAFRYFHFDEDRERSYGHTGGSFVCAAGGVFFNHHYDDKVTAYDVDDGYQVIPDLGGRPVVTEDAFYMSGSRIVAYAAAGLRANPHKRADNRLWACDVDATGDLIKAGDRLYAAGDGQIAAIRPPKRGGDGAVVWQQAVDGKVERLVAADKKLFAVTLDGRVLAFGADKTKPRLLDHEPERATPPPAAATQAGAIIEHTGVTEGYALFYGAADGDLLEALACQSQLSIVAIDPDADNVDRLRRRLDARGLYGTRIALLEGDPFTVELPRYLASLTVVADPPAARFEPSDRFLDRIFTSMRPYGGKTWIPATGPARDQLLETVAAGRLPGIEARPISEGVILSREGPLPDSAYWTHQYGDVANTVKSDDRRVKMPLGLLWFGGSSNEDVLPRHGHGPSPQVIGGRLFVEGVNCLNARDVYTGRPLWKTDFDDLGTLGVYYDETYLARGQNQQHIPGANARGANFVAALDATYVLQGGSCVVLDAATGQRLDTFSLPKGDADEPPEWGYVGVYEDFLVAGCDFAAFSKRLPDDAEELKDKTKKDLRYLNYDKTASMQLAVMDRHTGEIHWTLDAHHGFIHNGIAVANDTVYCLDRVPPYLENALLRRGKQPPKTCRLLALDVRTGEVRWQQQENVFGTWLGYSKEHDLLLQATRPSSDMVRGEDGKRMIVYRATDGQVVWDITRDYFNPPILHGDRIITHRAMYNLLTGEPILRPNPLTGAPMPWSYERTKGCGYGIASEYLLTFRSSAAAYYDLVADGGTGHFGGFKSGCSANLIAADGVLNAPDYTRTCTCSYQNQTSLAFVHMPDVEVWTTYPKLDIDGPITRLGLNLGAPGDRKAQDGTLWLEFPAVGGDSPDVEIVTEPEEAEWFTHHVSWIEEGDLEWVGASGAEGLTRLELTLAPDAGKPRAYTVRLVFAEPHDLAPGQRVFSIEVQGREVLADLDVVKAAAGPRRTHVVEFENVKVKDTLTVEFFPSQDCPIRKPILCGIEVVAEDA